VACIASQWGIDWLAQQLWVISKFYRFPELISSLLVSGYRLNATFFPVFVWLTTIICSHPQSVMGINCRNIAPMLRRENDLLKARNHKLDARLNRHQQAYLALNRMDKIMCAMRSRIDLKS
jgi:uncharacterized protein YqfA (UPF0365 family)